jgi:hypothetical protein
MTEDKRKENIMTLEFMKSRNLTIGKIMSDKFLRYLPWCWQEPGHEGDCGVWYMPLLLPDHNQKMCIKWKENKY